MHSAGGADVKETAAAAPAESNGRTRIRQEKLRRLEPLRLVTALFHNRSEAEYAIRWLVAQGIPAQDIYVGPPAPSAEVGYKGAEVDGSRKEVLPFRARESPASWTGLQTGLIMGTTGGLMAGLAVGLSAWILDRLYDLPGQLSSLLENPLWSVGGGIIVGLVAGTLIVRIIAWSLAWLKNRLPLSAEETTITVRCAADKLELVSSALLRSQAHHLNVSHAAVS